MIQQVNLYQEALWQQQKKPAVLYYLSALLLLCLSLAGLAFYLNGTLPEMEMQLQEARSALEKQKSEVKRLQDRLQGRKVDETLIMEIENWQQKVDELIRSLNAMDMEKPDDGEKFSVHLQAFAKRVLENIWLSRIHIDRKKTLIELEGTTLEPEKLPLFLQGLQKEPSLDAYGFSSLLMEQSQKTPRLVHFKLGALAKEEKENDPG